MTKSTVTLELDLDSMQEQIDEWGNPHDENTDSVLRWINDNPSTMATMLETAICEALTED